MPSIHSVNRGTLMTAFILLFAGIGMSQTTSKSTSAKKKTAVPVASKRPVAKGNRTSVATATRRTGTTTAVSTREEAHRTGNSRAQARKVVVTRKLVHGRWVRTTQIVHSDPGPSYQTHPDTERYQQIQQALAQKGYFKGEPNGQWGDDSVAAMKQFQTEQKISNDGKISSLSLIGLGLGPNRETAAAKADAPAPNN